MFNLIKKILFILTPPERKRATALVVLVTIMALVDMLGVASIIPFIAILTNPGLIETNLVLNSIFIKLSKLGVESSDDFLFILGLFVFVMLVLSVSFKSITIFFQVRFVSICEYSISKRLVEGYLGKPYSFFLYRHSADIGKTVLSEVAQVIGRCLNPLVQVISQGMIVISLLGLLVYANPKLALLVFFTFGFTYIIIFYFIRSHVRKIGKERLDKNNLRFLSVNEAFNAIKEIKVSRLEKFYLDRFANPAKIFANTEAQVSIISALPRYVLEIIAFGGIILIILNLMLVSNSLNEILPILTLYAYSGYRLMPALQQMYVSLTQLTFGSHSIDKIYDDLKNIKPTNEISRKEYLTFKKNISLKNITFYYPSSKKKILDDINLNIPINSTIAFMGTTGSGKTTTVDIITGLLNPQIGSLKIDGRIVTKSNLSSWQNLIGYVPQSIYLSDDTIANNIALGLNNKDIDQKLIIKAAKISNLHNFIMEDLPQKYSARIGEKGVRLSGGQRQRIGIARAIYKNPKVLILDEATNALDVETEEIILNHLKRKNLNLTIILITHRLSAAKICDVIYKFKKGKFEKI